MVRLALAVVLAIPALAHATPPDIYGFGARSTSLGGAVSADVRDTSANYHNPAGLARAEGVRLSVGYLSLSPDLRINGRRSEVERFGALTVGMIAPLSIDDVTLAFGLGLVLPDQRLARTRSVVVDRPRWELYDTRSGRIYLAAHLAVKFAEWISVAGGITFQAPSELTMDLTGDLDIAMPEERSRLRHQFEGDLTSIRYPQAGLQIIPHERFAIGVTYRGSYTLRSTINALADVRVARLADLTFALRSDSVNLFGPPQVSVSTAFYPIVDRLRIGLEVTWYGWRKHPSLISENDIVLALEPALVAIPEEIIAIPPMDLGLHDVYVPRASVEWTAVATPAVELDLRAGYAFENSPFPEQTGIQNFVDGDKHFLSGGLGLRLTDLEPTIAGHLAFDAYFLYIHVAEREHVKTSLTDPVGDFVSEGRLFGFGLNAEVAFE